MKKKSTEENLVSLKDLCNEISISTATGRNWIKLGKITPEIIKKTPYFTKKYLKSLKDDLNSGEKSYLKSRRNKTHVSGNNIYNSYISNNSKNIKTVEAIIEKVKQLDIEITEEIMLCILYDCASKLIGNKDGFDFLLEDLKPNFSIKQKYPDLFVYNFVYEKTEDILGLLYLSLRNIGKRKATGSYYTPTHIVKKLCSTLSYNGKILDPCCGTGNFILQLPDNLNPENIYAFDIDVISIKLARINFALKYNIKNKDTIYSHIAKQNYLETSLSDKFDIILGNPPWGYNFNEEEKRKYKNKYKTASSPNIESYDLFVEKALSDLEQDGILSFVLPESILNVKSHEKIRSIILKENSIKYLEYLGDVFDNVQCPSIIIKILHDGKNLSTKSMLIKEKNRKYRINLDRQITSEYFNFALTDEEYTILEKISKLSNSTTLKNQADFALGIVTGDNKKYVSYKKTSKNEPVLKGSNIQKYKILPTNNYIEFIPKEFQQVALEKYYRAKEKLFYKFISDKLVFAYDNNQTLSLNSCNILIPKIPKISIKYVMMVLNSKTAQFYFKKRFNSLKVLRSHIESIPIPIISEKEQEILENLLSENKYNEIDIKISQLFGLNEYEYNIIKENYE